MNTTAYTGRATNWTSVAVSVVLSLLLIALAGTTVTSADAGYQPVLVVVAIVLVVLFDVLTASDVRVTCGPQGVTAHWGIFGWPRVRYALGDIADASVAEIPWWAVSFGFWWTPTRTVCTVRSGPALRLRLQSGRTVTITVPDPHAALAALQAGGEHP